jgi:hypothetical protein
MNKAFLPKSLASHFCVLPQVAPFLPGTIKRPVLLSISLVLAVLHSGCGTQAMYPTIADCNKAIALNPNDSSAYEKRGLSEEHMGDIASAIADFNKAIELNPDPITGAYLYRGVAKKKNGDF